MQYRPLIFEGDIIAYIIIPIIILTFLASVFIVPRFAGKKRLRREAEAALDKPPAAERRNELESISEYYFLAEQTDISADETTWNDLDMDDIFDRLDTCESSVGEEYLYALLHRRPAAEEEELFRGLMKRLDGDRELRIKVCASLRNLGIFNYNGAAKSCFTEEGFEYIGSEAFYTLLPIVFLLLTAAMLLFKLYLPALLVFSAGMILAIAVNIKIRGKIESRLGTVRYLCRIFCCADALGRLCPEEKVFSELAELYKPFSPAVNKITAVNIARNSDMSEIMNFYTLKELGCYCRVRKLIADKGKLLRRLYDLIGMTDAACAALNFRASAEIACEPVFTDERVVRTKRVIHPLIENAVPNSFEMDGNVLITGSNASGKSSFVKALSVNILLAQSIFTCTAESFTLRRCRVVTSMAVRDDVCAGDSYFVAEIKSMRRLVDAAEKEYCFCAIDEILKGTNTVERIAASASILSAMADTESLFIAATHDIELTSMLADRYRNIHFSEDVEKDGVRFDYTLKEGAANTRNAIMLLKVYGFPERITSAAEKLALLEDRD